MPVKKIGVLSPKLYASLGTVAVDFPMIANAVLTLTSMSTKFFSMYWNNSLSPFLYFK
jgi:hypothetical protein